MQSAWRASPAATAAKWSRGQWRRARHLNHLSDVIADGLAQGGLRLIVDMPPRHGKEIADDEPVLTPQGWRRHGDLRPGDYVFGPDGHPTKVLAVAPPNMEKVIVRFSNGDAIRCHPNHEWTVFDRACGQWRTMETRQIARRVLRNGPDAMRGGRWTLQMPNMKPIQFPHAELPLDPYVLGAWLGDGTEGASLMAHDGGDTEVVDAIITAGFATSRRYVQPNTGVHYVRFGHSGLTQGLRTAGVFVDKHIPEKYLRASIQQRLELLAGLVDTDGHVEAHTGRVRFSTCNERLRDGVFDIATALGFRPYIMATEPGLSSSGIQGRKTTWQVGFQPILAIPTRIPRKRVNKLALRRRIGIVAVESCADAPGRCIQVDRADGLYLVGRSCVPTHNSEAISNWTPAWFLANWHQKRVILASYEATFAASWGRKVRNTLLENPDMGVRLAPDVQATSGWETVQGGGMVTAGVGGPITGRGADLLIIDDPIKNEEEARSPVHRENIWQWWLTTARTRLEPGGSVIIVMTRWDVDDLAGRLLRDGTEQWTHISLPAIAEKRDAINRAEGEPLWAERYPREALEKTRRDVGEDAWASLYQQRPNPAGRGLYFDVEAATDLLMEARTMHLLETRLGGLVRIKKKRIIGERYLMGGDCAWGEKGAFAVSTIENYKTGEHVAEVYGRPPLDELAEINVKLCREYNDAYAGVERNGEGRVVCEKMVDLGYGSRMYWHDHDKDQPGWLTQGQSGATRLFILNELEEDVRNKEFAPFCADGCTELLSFIRDEKGRPGPRPGTYADHVMSWAIARQMRKYAHGKYSGIVKYPRTA